MVITPFFIHDYMKYVYNRMMYIVPILSLVSAFWFFVDENVVTTAKKTAITVHLSHTENVWSIMCNNELIPEKNYYVTSTYAYNLGQSSSKTSTWFGECSAEMLYFINNKERDTTLMH